MLYLNFRVTPYEWVVQRPLSCCWNRINRGCSVTLKFAYGYLLEVNVRRDVTMTYLRRTRATFKQLTQFGSGRITGLREEGFLYRAIAASMQRNSSRMIRVGNNKPSRIRQLENMGWAPNNDVNTRWDIIFAWRGQTVQLHLNSWQQIGQLRQLYHYLLHQFVTSVVS